MNNATLIDNKRQWDPRGWITVIIPAIPDPLSSRRSRVARIERILFFSFLLFFFEAMQYLKKKNKKSSKYSRFARGYCSPLRSLSTFSTRLEVSRCGDNLYALGTFKKLSTGGSFFLFLPLLLRALASSLRYLWLMLPTVSMFLVERVYTRWLSSHVITVHARFRRNFSYVDPSLISFYQFLTMTNYRARGIFLFVISFHTNYFSSLIASKVYFIIIEHPQYLFLQYIFIKSFKIYLPKYIYICIIFSPG